MHGKKRLINDANFLREIEKGNEEALRYIIQKYGNLVRSVIGRYLYLLKEEQEECFDDVFLSIWEHIDSFDKTRNGFANWVAGIARYKAIDYLRRYKKQFEEVGKLRERLLGKKKYLFCTVARLAKEKNIDFLFRVLSDRKKSHGSDFRMALVGEGPYQKQLCRLAEELDIREEIIFVGKVPNDKVKNYCKAADLFLFSSLSETQGIVLLEAMAAATPVLAVKASGVRDIVVNGRNGYMTYMSENEYGNKLDDILKLDRTYLEQGALETAEKYEMQEIAKMAAFYYNIAIQNHGLNKASVNVVRKTGGKASWKHFVF